MCFASINLFAEDRFYPCSGRDTDPPPPEPEPVKRSPQSSAGPSVTSHTHRTRQNKAKRDSSGSKSGNGDEKHQEPDKEQDDVSSPAKKESRESLDSMSSMEQSPLPSVKGQEIASGSASETETKAGAGRDNNDHDNSNSNSNSTSNSNIINIAMTPIGPGPWDPLGRSKLTVKQRDELCKKASRELRYGSLWLVSLLDAAMHVVILRAAYHGSRWMDGWMDGCCCVDRNILLSCYTV